MAYEIYLFPAAPGADIEEAGEALLARIERFEETPASAASLPDMAPLVAALRAADATLTPDPPPPDAPNPARPLLVLSLSDPAGLGLTLARTFARIRIPYAHRGDAALAVFDRAFRLLGAAATQTGWRAYDPQDAGPVALDDDGRDGALLIYLTAMDQLRPADSVRP